MLRIHFTAKDLARTRIAAEPDLLWEVLLSLHVTQSASVMQNATGRLVYGPWRRHASGSVSPGDLALLRELAPPAGYSPDFLTPIGAGPGLDAGLELLLASPREKVRTQLEYLAIRRPVTAWSHELATGRVEPMRRLAAAMRSYHDTALAPYWRSIRSHVVADRARRVQEWSGQGIDHMLSHLHPGVRWTPPVLEVFDFADTDLHLDGRGLLLQPSFFCWQAPTKLRDTELQPILVYPTQPAPGELSQTDRPPKLGALLGRTRAMALEATVSGCTTSELARLCGVSLAAASHQATVLRDAALITTRREGGAVRHEITPLGLTLLNGLTLTPSG
ncbi:ArsR/SmtB family transcription factor [Allorhizocola rhizosphaerae]|uniref:ArsR/SmtB family transcription factor n=1 Tax=Allorhizocola rhizosphaerae TaxID=1872709 RepID=UPI000E3DA995|nr:winged helix-turn-helix domain-containing protein [Allorhizocola rhizosphaerae]